jgi:Tol biopolymer transport system component
MTMRFQIRMPRLLVSAFACVLAWSMTPASASAQFGRNKVQFDDFDFHVLSSEHFDWHFYPDESEAVEDAVRMGERWYERFARSFQHEFEQRKPVILYADHPDFQQTNTLSGSIGEGTGGVTESLKNRVIMPLAGDYWDTDHVLGHELVHAFQYNIAQSRTGGGLQGLNALPLWLIEGMAEYLSVGRDDPLTAMWIRDAIRRDELPTIRQMTRDTRFFPYRFGQALWAYIGGTYGDDAIIEIYRRSLQVGFEGAIGQVLGISTDTLSVRWKDEISREYMPLLQDRTPPANAGNLILAPSMGAGSMNIAPSLSPDGRFVAFLSDEDLFSVDLYMADAQSGRIIRKLSSANSDPHVDALRYIDSSGTWSPDSRFFAYSVVAGGNNELVIVNTDNGAITQRITFDEWNIGAVANPAWSPDARYIAFSGSVGGITDLFLYDLDSDEVLQLTDDKYGDWQPAWSPDGRTLAFTSDRGPQTNFEALTYSRPQLSLIDVATREVSVVPLFGNVKHINPQYSADGNHIYFISDQDGFSDIYDLQLDTRVVRRITNIATGVSGHTYLAPAMSVSASGVAAFSVFDDLEFHIFTLDLQGRGNIVAARGDAELQPGRRLPPVNPDRFSRVDTYLADAQTGLLPSGTYQADEAEEYSTDFSLDFLGQPTIGIGADTYGGYVGGSTSAYFSDMLGNKAIAVALQANGTFKDIGGTIFYQDLTNRWNWGVGGGRIPYLIPYYTYGSDTNGPYTGFLAQRVFLTTLMGQVAYPFSTTQRVELNTNATRYSYDIELDKYYYDAFGRTYAFDRESLEAPPADNLYEASIALVGDNAFFGFVSPIRGSRYRFEVGQTAGSASFTTVIGDVRRYFSPTKNLAVGFRALHYGRYGLNSQEDRLALGPLGQLFLGYETLIRGYAYESFDVAECGQVSTSCPAINRLLGNQLAVANLEVRIPFLGVEQYGLINFPYLPTELVLFADAGAAWTAGSSDSTDHLDLEWSRSGTARVPVVSTGVSARFNILGFLILEAYYAKPWQRPLKSWHWGFNLAPGW